MVRCSFSGLLLRLVVVLLCSLSCVELLPTAAAQTPSAEQIEMFQNLPADQQQSILEAMGGGGRSSSSSSFPATSSGVRSDRRLDFPQTVRPRTTTTDEEGEEEDQLGMGGPP